MPNYCHNRVSIRGEKDILNELQNKFNTYRTNEGTFSDWCDTFFTDRRDKKENFFDEIYDYGTKWWDFEIDRLSDTTMLVIGSSAWSPPTEFLRKLSEQYAVEIRGEYEEPGDDFGGYAMFTGGVEDDNCFSYREWVYMNGKELFFADLEMEAQWYETFEDFKDAVLDTFENKLTPRQIDEVREEFNRYKDELNKRKNDQISLA
jgi:hypothetical protein